MIFYETLRQPRGLLLLLYAGAGVGLLYDLLASLRWKRGKLLLFLADFFFCMLSGLLCFGALALGGESRLRLYACVGLLCGAVLYGCGIRRVARGMAEFVKMRLAGRRRQEKREPAANAITEEKGA